MEQSGLPLILWDGECGLCSRAIACVRRHDAAHLLNDMPYQLCTLDSMTPKLREECSRALHVITPQGKVLRAGRAVLYILKHTNHPILAWALGIPPLIWIVEAGYWLVARNRAWIGMRLLRGDGMTQTSCSCTENRK